MVYLPSAAQRVALITNIAYTQVLSRTMPTDTASHGPSCLEAQDPHPRGRAQGITIFKNNAHRLPRSLLLSTAIIWGVFVLDPVAQQIPWLDLRILALFGASIVTGICFLLIEAFWAAEPIFPLRLLLNQDVVTSYMNLGFQSAAQIAVGVLRPQHICLLTSSTGDGVRSTVFPGLGSCICCHCWRTSYAVRYWKCSRRLHY